MADEILGKLLEQLVSECVHKEMMNASPVVTTTDLLAKLNEVSFYAGHDPRKAAAAALRLAGWAMRYGIENAGSIEPDELHKALCNLPRTDEYKDR